MTRMGTDMLWALVAMEARELIAASYHSDDVLRGIPLLTEKQRRTVSTVQREPKPQSRQVRRQMERQAYKQGMKNE